MRLEELHGSFVMMEFDDCWIAFLPLDSRYCNVSPLLAELIARLGWERG